MKKRRLTKQKKYRDKNRNARKTEKTGANSPIFVSGFPSAWSARATGARILRALAREGHFRAGDRLVLSMSGVGAREMARLNLKHRRKRGPTDVLSFEQPAPGGAGLPRAPKGVRFLGDLLLCLPVVRAQAREHGHGVRAELAVLITHGILHLLGFDHERSARAARQMSELERKVLDRAARAQKNGHAGLIARVHAKEKP